MRQLKYWCEIIKLLIYCVQMSCYMKVGVNDILQNQDLHFL